MREAFAAFDRNIRDWHFWWSVGMVHLWLAVFGFVTAGLDMTSGVTDNLSDAIASGIVATAVLIVARLRGRATRRDAPAVQP